MRTLYLLRKFSGKQWYSLTIPNLYTVVDSLEGVKQAQMPGMHSGIYLKKDMMQFRKESCGGNNAHKLNVKLPERDIIYWTSMISELAKKGLNDLSLLYFLRMRRVGIEINEYTFSTVVGACSQLSNIDFGITLHCLILKKGSLTQVFVASGLVTMYAKCNYIKEARMVFDEMPKRDDITWNLMITAYTQNGLSKEAVNLFALMLRSETNLAYLVNCFVIASVLKACASGGCIRTCECLHTYVIKLDFALDIVVAGSMVDMYSKNGSVERAQRVFYEMKKWDIVAWNAMIAGCAQNSCEEEAIGLFYHMLSEDFLPNQTTFASILKAISEMGDGILGRYFHVKIIKNGCLLDTFVGTSLVDMYAKCLLTEDSAKSFEEIPKKNLVSFNAIITGYNLSGKYKEAFKAYINLRRENMAPDSSTFSALLSSCSTFGAFSEGTEVHTQSIKFGLDSSVSVGNSLVSLYSKCNLMDRASRAFKSVTLPTVISWAGIISSFTQNGEGEEALKYFYKMCKLSLKPDEFCFTSVLKAIANLSSVEQGKHVHACVIKTGLEFDVFVGSALIDMYSKCGVPEDSLRIFTDMPEKNVVSWNSMILGFAQNGYSEKSLRLFGKMMKFGIKPTSVTFIGVLFACSHAGLVEEGRDYFDLMIFTYGILPSIEHYTCMVDLLGRAGYLIEAETLITHSPFSLDLVIWRVLLAACRVHNNTNMGVRIAEYCLKIELHESSTYVILSNIYASNYLWYEVSGIRKLMRGIGVEKDPGCSWIVVRNVVHVYVAKDGSHFFKDETISLLESLTLHMKSDDHGR